MDMSQIDPDLLKEVPIDTPISKRPLDLSEGEEDLFAGFTFEGAEVGSVIEATVAGESTNLAL